MGTNGKYQYEWRTIGIMAVAFGMFGLVSAGLQTNFRFGAVIALICVAATVTFGAVMRKLRPRKTSIPN